MLGRDNCVLLGAPRLEWAIYGGEVFPGIAERKPCVPAQHVEHHLSRFLVQVVSAEAAGVQQPGQLTLVVDQASARAPPASRRMAGGHDQATQPLVALCSQGPHDLVAEQPPKAVTKHDNRMIRRHQLSHFGDHSVDRAAHGGRIRIGPAVFPPGKLNSNHRYAPTERGLPRPELRAACARGRHAQQYWAPVRLRVPRHQPPARHERSRSICASLSISWASAAAVGSLSRWRTDSGSPVLRRSAPTARAASSECPPSSKKFAWASLIGRENNSLHVWQTCRSRSVRGGRPMAVVPVVRASVARSTLPVGSVGSAATTSSVAGTMKSGSRAANSSLISATQSPESVPGAVVTASPRLSAPATLNAAAARTVSTVMATCSISPSSTLNPRTLICSSARPRYSICPSARDRALSPVRYMRVPSPAKGSGENRSSVRSGRFR